MKLLGNVPANGKAPGGMLRHKGWKAEKIDLPPLPTGFQRVRHRAGRNRNRVARPRSPMNIGIDLGTTNSALAYIPEIQGELPDYPEIQVLAIPQYVAPGQIEARRTLPSFLFLGDQTYVGAYAREQGALVPTKSVHSAKSWLSNPEVDRTAKILPWDAQEGGRVLSPVDVSTAILTHHSRRLEPGASECAARVAGRGAHRAGLLR